LTRRLTWRPKLWRPRDNAIDAKFEFAIITWTLPIKIKTYNKYARYYKEYVDEETEVETQAVKAAETPPLTPSPSSPSTRGPSPSRSRPTTSAPGTTRSTLMRRLSLSTTLPRVAPTINVLENIDVKTVKKGKSVKAVKNGSRTPYPSWPSTHGPTSSSTGSPIVFNTSRRTL
jgi:hypothetical protein